MASTHITIELEDGTKKTFNKQKIKARWVKEVFKLQKELDALGKKGDFDEALDRRVKFTTNLFNDKELTEDAIYDGIESEKIGIVLDRILHDIVGRPEDEDSAKNPGK